MGVPCGKTTQQKIQPTDKYNAESPSLQTLANRIDFQMCWEDKASESHNSIDYIWPLTMTKKDIKDVYIFDRKKIGVGHFGSVKKALHKLDKGKTYAIKTVQKDKLNGNISLFKNELDMLRFSDHPNIIQFYEIYQDSKQYYFVMEYCQGGDIAQLVQKNGPLEESTTKKILYQALLSICHLHDCGIVHRDIKADNFLFKSSDINSSLKLIDFGLSKRFQRGSKMKSVVGTPYYVAPEVIEKLGYTEKYDMWSLGVMMYMMLAANFPFKGDNNYQIYEKVKKGQYSIVATKQLLSCSPEGKTFLKRLLDKNPNRRLSAREALRDPWFTQLNIDRNNLGKAVLNNEILDKLRKFSRLNKLSKEVIRILVILHEDDPVIQNLKSAFFYLDILNNGIINCRELQNCYLEYGESLTQKEAEDIIQSLSLRTKKVIVYTEFLTAVVDSSFYLNEEALQEAFTRLDVDQDKFISQEDIKECFARFGVDFHKSYIIGMIEEFSKGDKISYSDFVFGMKNTISNKKLDYASEMISDIKIVQKKTDILP